MAILFLQLQKLALQRSLVRATCQGLTDHPHVVSHLLRLVEHLLDLPDVHFGLVGLEAIATDAHCIHGSECELGLLLLISQTVHVELCADQVRSLLLKQLFAFHGLQRSLLGHRIIGRFLDIMPNRLVGLVDLPLDVFHLQVDLL